MGYLKKITTGTKGAIVALTIGVAVKNAFEVRPDEEVGHNQSYYEKYVKRPQDFLLATVALAVLSPILMVTSIAIGVNMGTPVLFTQDRPGRDGKIFKLYKFRSMNENRDEKGELLPDIQRITPFGKFLRNTSIDELPELLNIVKGDMAIVGPRPLLVKYLPLYNETQKQRHDVRPGLTGYAQVHGRNCITWPERLNLDVIYTKNVSFMNDVKIVFDTVKMVIEKKGIETDQTNVVTMEEFKGEE